MTDHEFLDDYFQRFRKAVFDSDVRNELIRMRDLVLQTRAAGNKLIFAGNGASATISSHTAVDFTKQGGTRGICFNDAGLITCFANDYGYEQWVTKALEFHAVAGDIVVLISSSGKSPNIVNAAKYAREKNLTVIAFSGFERDNPLSSVADLNFWVDSKAYNIIENTHQFWLTTVVDLVVGKAEYGAT